MRRIFDPDLLLQDLHPRDVSFPIMAQLDVARLDDLTRLRLPPTLRFKDQPSVLVSAFDDTQLPIMVRLWRESTEQPTIWVPWHALKVELTILPN